MLSETRLKFYFICLLTIARPPVQYAHGTTTEEEDDDEIFLPLLVIRYQSP
eukprot:gene7999-5559_t